MTSLVITHSRHGHRVHNDTCGSMNHKTNHLGAAFQHIRARYELLSSWDHLTRALERDISRFSESNDPPCPIRDV